MEYRVVIFTACFFFFSVFVSLSQGCPKGYYGSPCTMCPDNTYKDFSGDAASCKTCPINSGHSLRGSISVRDCECIAGYQGVPDETPCTKRHCEQLVSPLYADIVGDCLTDYLSVCRMECHEGYEAFGNKERKCEVKDEWNIMAWSGIPLACIAIRCPVLFVANAQPPTGVCTSVDLTYNTRCTFTCRAGYELKGYKERVCQLDKTWSGTATSCVAQA